MADKVEEEAIVKRGVLLDKINCQKESNSNPHFFAFLKEKVFKHLKDEEIKEAAEAILYINQELVTDSAISGGPFSQGELTHLASASRETIKDFFDNNPPMAFRLYMWFHMHRQEVEGFYRQKRKDLYEGKQKRWKEIRKQVFKQKLKEVNSAVDEGEKARLIERFNNNTLEMILLPYEVYTVGDRLHRDTQAGVGILKARENVLGGYVEPFSEIYDIASEVTIDPKRRLQLTEASFMSLGEYPHYAPAISLRQRAARNLAFSYWKDYFLPEVQIRFKEEPESTPQQLTQRLKFNPTMIPLGSANEGMTDSVVIDAAVAIGAYQAEGRASSVQNYSALQGADVSFQCNHVEENGELINNTPLKNFYQNFRQALRNIVNQLYWGDNVFYSKKTLFTYHELISMGTPI